MSNKMNSDEFKEVRDKVARSCVYVIDRCHDSIFSRSEDSPLTPTDMKSLMVTMREAWFLYCEKYSELLDGDLDKLMGLQDDDDDDFGDDGFQDFLDDDDDEWE